MTRFQHGLRKILTRAIVAGFVCLLMFTAVNWVDPNASTRAAVESILIAESTREEKLEDLAPYVKIGDHISSVHDRMAPKPMEDFRVDRPTEHAYGLDESNLVLAIRGNGRIVGIGRHIHGTDDGTMWLAPPNW